MGTPRMRNTTISSSDYVYPTVRPWRDIFNDLIQNGCHINRMAELIGKKQSTVSYWYNDAKELPDSAARSVLQLHMRYCGYSQTEIRLKQSKVEG